MHERHTEDVDIEIECHPHVCRVEREVMDAAQQRFARRGRGLGSGLNDRVVHAVLPVAAPPTTRFIPAHGAKRSGREANILRISDAPPELCVSTTSRRKGLTGSIVRAETKVGFSIAAGVKLRPDYLIPLPFCAPANDAARGSRFSSKSALSRLMMG